ncbi:MAG: hypothetical protein R3F59_19115 [Myxococcota bacterium]
MSSWRAGVLAAAVSGGVVFGVGVGGIGAVAAMVMFAALLGPPAPPPTPTPAPQTAPSAPLEASASVAPVPAPPPRATVSVNGHPLSDADVAAFTRAFGQPPAPGAWWYDARSGLFGPAGRGAAGVLPAGAPAAPLRRDASGGHTDVSLNGRVLPADELAFYRSLWGVVLPGAYWLDADGAVGVVGDARPIARAGSPADRWLSGDEWSGHTLSSGNWDRSGQGNDVIMVDGEVLNLP